MITYYQYLIRNDNLVDRLISTVQSAKNASLRSQKDATFKQAPSKNRTIQELEDTSLSIINGINKITSDTKTSAANKLKSIDSHIKDAELRLLDILSVSRSIRSDDETRHDFIEARSKTLQGRLTGILKELEFDEESSEKKLISAIDYFKNNTTITDKAPREFLDVDERTQVFENPGFRVSLYKALLFFAVSDGMKAGTLNLRYSFRYQSLEKYLIDKDEWRADKKTILKRHGMEDIKDFKYFLEPIKERLDDSFKHTNERVIRELNTYFKFDADSFILKTPALEREEDEDDISRYLPQDTYLSIIDILDTINKKTHFLDSFSHYNIKNKDRVSSNLLLATILGYGCNINIAKIGKISKGINPNQLDNTRIWYFREDNTMEANDKIVAYMEELEIVRLLRNQEDINHTSSDGQKFNMRSSVDSSNAGYSFKYFGTAKGVSVYTFIDESHRLFYSSVINVSSRESGYVIDGLMHNEVVKSDIHSTDTHGFTELIFGLTNLLGFSFAPRIKNLKAQQLYSLKERKEYLRLGHRLLPKRKIKVELIEENWEDILRFIATIKSRKTSASQLLHRLTSYSRQHKLYTALKEFGKIIKTDFLLTYIDDVGLRQRIEKQLNKVESSHRFSKAVFFGSNAEFQVATVEEQNIANNCKRSIQNSVILWNYLYMTQKLKDAASMEERDEIIKVIQQSSIVHWSHINFYGEYDFTKTHRKNKVYF